MSDDMVYGHDDDCCCGCGAAPTFEETPQYDAVAADDDPSYAYDDDVAEAPEPAPTGDDAGDPMEEPQLPVYAEAAPVESVEPAFEAPHVEPVHIDLGDPAPASVAAPAAPEYISLPDPAPVGVSASAAEIPAAVPPRWDQVSASDWGAMTAADQLAAFLGRPVTAETTHGPQVEIPIPGLVPTIWDINEQISDQHATTLAPSGLTVTHENGSMVYEDEGGYKSGLLSDFNRDSSGHYERYGPDDRP